MKCDASIATGCSNFGLTPREQEVLALAAQGLSRLQIGEQLALRLYPISSHLKKIFRLVMKPVNRSTNKTGCSATAAGSSAPASPIHGRPGEIAGEQTRSRPVTRWQLCESFSSRLVACRNCTTIYKKQRIFLLRPGIILS
jgi:hypothetical protein